MTLQWDPGTGGNTARVDVTFRRSQYAVTYHTDTSVGHVGRRGRAGAYLIAFDRQGQRWRLDFGHFRSHEQAKQACEQHYAKGCDLKDAERERRW